MYSFTIDENGKRKQSPVYYVPDKILMFFNRLGLIDPASAEKEDALKTLKEQIGKPEYLNNAAKLGAVSGISEHKYIKRPIRDGFLYVVEDRASPLVSEYKIIGGSLEPVFENQKQSAITKDIRKSTAGNDYKFVYVSKDNKTLFAYSGVQWSTAYLKDCISDKNNLRKRFQAFDPNSNEYPDQPFPFSRHNSIQIACPAPTGCERELFDELDDDFIKTPRFRELMALSNLSNEYQQISQLDNTTIFFHFTLHDPIGCANDIRESLENQYKYHLALIGGLPIGKSPEEMMIANNEVDWTNEETKQCFALYTSTDIIHGMINCHWTSRRKYANDTTKKIMKKVLGIEERKNSFNKIVNFRNDLGKLMTINYYQNALLDYYYNNNTVFIVNGQDVFLKHICWLNIKPSRIDPLSSSFAEDEYDKFIEKSYFYEKDEPPLSQPKWLANGQELQYVCRELLNDVSAGDYLRKYAPEYLENSKVPKATHISGSASDLRDDKDKWNLYEPIAVTADKISSNVDTFVNVYIYLIDNDIRAAQFAKNMNRVLPAQATQEVMEWSKEELKKLLSQYELNYNSKKALRDFFRKAKGLVKGQHATKLQQTEIEGWIKQLHNNADMAEEVFKPGDGRTKLGKMNNIVRKSVTEEVNATTRLRIEAETMAYNNRMNQALDDQILVLEGDRVHSLIKDSRYWTSIVAGLSAVNMVFAGRRLAKEKDSTSLGNLIGSIMELTAVSMSAYTAFTKKTVGGGILKSLGAKNAFFTLSARLSIISGAIGGIVSIVDGIAEIQKRNEKTGIAFIVSGGFTLGAAGTFWAAYAGVVGAFAWTGPLAVLAIGALIVGLIISKDEFEKYLSSSVYNEDIRIRGLDKMQPSDVLLRLYDIEREKACVFEADNKQNYDLQDFGQMLGWLYDKMYRPEFEMKALEEHRTPNESIVFCRRFAITCDLPVIPPGAQFEYCMQVVDNDMDRVRYNMDNYLFNEEIPRRMEVIKPEIVPTLTPKKEGDKLAGYTVDLQFNVSSLLQQYERDEYVPRGRAYQDNRRRYFAEKKYEIEFVLAVRILLDDIGQQAWPINIDGMAQYYVYRGNLFTRTWYTDQKFDASTKVEYIFAPDLQIDTKGDILRDIQIESEEAKNEYSLIEDGKD